MPTCLGKTPSYLYKSVLVDPILNKKKIQIQILISKLFGFPF